MINLEIFKKLVYKIPCKGSCGDIEKISFDDEKRKKILKRDGYACRLCGERVPLDVHHIIPNGNAAPNNLISLCKCCHRDIHINLSFKRGYSYYDEYDGKYYNGDKYRNECDSCEECFVWYGCEEYGLGKCEKCDECVDLKE